MFGDRTATERGLAAPVTARRKPASIAVAKARLRTAAVAAELDPVLGLRQRVRSAPWAAVGVALMLGAVVGASPGLRRGLAWALRAGTASTASALLQPSRYRRLRL